MTYKERSVAYVVRDLLLLLGTPLNTPPGGTISTEKYMQHVRKIFRR